jgi:GTP-binding protein Era
MNSNLPAPSEFRSGLAVLLGRTNVGKSTLLNALVDAKVTIVTLRPQTTRHAVQGVVHRPGRQIVFVDTPGFFRTRRSGLVDRLHARARAALEGIDVVVHVVDPTRPVGAEDEMVLEVLRGVPQPKVLCLNKSDVRRCPCREAWLARAGEYVAMVEVSALARRGLAGLVDAILPLLPPGPPLYEAGEKTNVHRDFRITETVREKIYLLTGQEVPYRTAVVLETIEERATKEGTPLCHVKATILVAGERYKGMLIGAGGRKVRDIGTAAREDLERLLGRKVFLELSVRVDRGGKMEEKG